MQNPGKLRGPFRQVQFETLISYPSGGTGVGAARGRVLWGLCLFLQPRPSVPERGKRTLCCVALRLSSS